jgi:hypothetical protein
MNGLDAEETDFVEMRKWASEFMTQRTSWTVEPLGQLGKLDLHPGTMTQQDQPGIKKTRNLLGQLRGPRWFI